MFKKRKLKITISILIVFILLVIFAYYQNNAIEISEYTYQSRKITSQLDGYCILQISDLHNKSFGKENKYIISKVKEQNPDIIVITGDLVDSKHTDIKAALKFVGEIAKIAPVYYVTGNHEYSLKSEEKKQLMDKLQELGVVLLDDNYVSITEDLYLYGISEHTIKEEWSTLKELSHRLPDDSLKILLAHEPQYIKEYALENIDIVLSGHAHGGQIRIPFIDIGLVAPDQGIFPKYTSGEHLEDNTTMYISRGLGNSILPLRLFNRPEIVKIILKH